MHIFFELEIIKKKDIHHVYRIGSMVFIETKTDVLEFEYDNSELAEDAIMYLWSCLNQRKGE